MFVFKAVAPIILLGLSLISSPALGCGKKMGQNHIHGNPDSEVLSLDDLSEGYYKIRGIHESPMTVHVIELYRDDLGDNDTLESRPQPKTKVRLVKLSEQ